jgi:uncharacterized protein (TIGR02145 family)
VPRDHRWLGRMILIAFIALTASAAADPYVCGDADGSGSVDIADAVYLVTYIFASGPEPSPLLAGDASGDETLDISDAAYLVGYIFAGGSAPICPYGKVTDIDGNVYWTVRIGDKWWMMENLKVTHYRNGDSIPNVTDNGTWQGLSTGAHCEYNCDPAYVGTYGRLYNWYAVVDSRNIAPAGWHVPSDEEWQTLVDSLGGSAVAGGKLKEVGTTHWNSPNAGATNESDFSALPGGYRDLNGYFHNVGYTSPFWPSSEYSSSHAWYRSVNYDDSEVYHYYDNKHYGFSVRCVRD